MLSQDLVASHLKAALRSYHRTSSLETSPLVELLGLSASPGGSLAQALRERLRALLEKLRPAADIPLDSPGGLDYRILWLRYIQRQTQVIVCDELSIGSSSYYRHHRRALEALTSMLWDEIKQRESSAMASPSLTADPVLREARRLAAAARRVPNDQDDFLDQLGQTVSPLALQEGKTFAIEHRGDLPPAILDPGVLNQVVVGLIGAMFALKDIRSLTLRVEPDNDHTCWQLLGKPGARPCRRQIEAQPGISLARALMEAIGGELTLDEGPAGGLQIVLRLSDSPLPRTLLVIDDDPDLARLVQLYLQDENILVRDAHDAASLQEQLAAARPDVILLDLLMPAWDGWRILRYLKAAESTAAIPIIVCSVLTQPRLAMALGAHSVLQKPLAQGQFVTAIRQVLHPGHSRG